MKAYKSQIGQDKFVLERLNFKKGGTFVDIGAGHPIIINNTYIFEVEYDWTGVSLDYGKGQAHKCEHLSDDQYLKFWEDNRSCPLTIGNALEVDYIQLFEDAGLPEIIDYLDIDIEPPKASLQTLMKIPFDKYKFRVITFEHDDYRDSTNKTPAREYLLGLGYTYVPSNYGVQEDWYVLNDD